MSSDDEIPSSSSPTVSIELRSVTTYPIYNFSTAYWVAFRKKIPKKYLKDCSECFPQHAQMFHKTSLECNVLEENEDPKQSIKQSRILFKKLKRLTRQCYHHYPRVSRSCYCIECHVDGQAYMHESFLNLKPEWNTFQLKFTRLSAVVVEENRLKVLRCSVCRPPQY